MTSRQARRERREQERKTAKLARKAAPATTAPPISLEDEFSPELIAEARAVRERIARRAGLPTSSAAPSPAGFVPQPAAEHKPNRAEINRANAAHSTGPRTAQGLATSSRNAFKHGLASGELIIPGEDRTAFEALLQSLLDDHQPADTTEEMLIQEMAQSYWLTQRALRLQNECFTAEGVDEKRLALFLRYQTTHERAFHKALNTLIRLQRVHRAFDAPCARSDMERRKGNRGFVSQPRASSRRNGDEPAVLSEAKTQEMVFVSQNPAQTSESSLALTQNHREEPLENHQTSRRAA